MARVTIEKYSGLVDSFRLVVLAARRARDIGEGAPLTIARKNEKNPVLALREIEQLTVSLEDIESSLLHLLAPQVDALRQDQDMTDMPEPSSVSEAHSIPKPEEE